MGPTSSREVTQLVCQESDLQDGQMKEVEIEQNKILLVRNEGKFSAVSGLCTHYGAPLIKGALVGNRVRCPWHGACFNTTTGDIEEFPGLDCLHSYKVKVDCGKVYVTKTTKRVKEMSSREPGVCHTVLLIGGGPASLQCAETLRQNKYGGRIIMVIKDEKLPIDKTKLSKAMNIEIEKILLRPSDFLQKHDIEVWTEKDVVSVNTEGKVVTFSDGTTQPYDQLLVSTGARARALQVPGAEMENVKLLESYKDMLEEKNVKFYMNSGVAEMRGENGRVKEVVLQNGDVLQADVVISGIGVIPNSDFLKGSAVEVDSRNAVVVDKFMRTNIPDVFAAGDVVSFPLALREDKMVQIGHWQLAQAHGRVAALNMLKKQTEINSVPYFWTVLLGKSIRYTGYGEGYTDIVFKGNVEEMKFLAFYIKGDEAVAAASLNFDPAVSKVAELMASGQKITKSQAESQDLGWLQLP
uniref:Apoptosis inducing factor mitochondria associated 4 n=1 Tax=Astyanax mexicanus TaxID=7994 RepID=A0A3B1JV53_ASTMX